MVRIATIEDLDSICSVMEEARTALRNLGIDQWQNGNPNRSILQQDIVNGQGYVLELEGQIAAYCYLSYSDEPTYQEIFDGQWSLQGDYLVIHRVMVSAAFRRKNCAGILFSYAYEQARAHSCASIRIDTHRGNLPMQSLLKKNGFHYCGIIYLTDGAERLAYEKAL